MAKVPVTADRQWRLLMRHIGLSESTPMPIQRGVGIGSAISSNPVPRAKPPAMHQRSEVPK